MTTFDNLYLSILDEILHGEETEYKCGRNGGTLERFGVMASIDVFETFPLLTVRKVYPRPVLGELAAFLEGATNIKRFKELGCNYWDGFADSEGNLGPIYGAQWRAFDGLTRNDQIANLVLSLTCMPNSRRHFVSAWNPTDTHSMALPPCHVSFQCNVREGEILDMIVYQRSVDVILGMPADFVLYASLMELLGNSTGLHPGMLSFMFGSAHVYETHVEKAKQMLGQQSAPQAPAFDFKGMTVDNFDPFEVEISGYKPGPAVNFELIH